MSWESYKEERKKRENQKSERLTAGLLTVILEGSSS